jgi:tryptophanyl-tRNA synthetase
VPEVCELTWMIGSLTPMGLLERAHSYKDKTAKGISPNFGLFAYPVLMAADILLYDTNAVPVGQDQKQHLEMTRDIAIKFNQTYGETFVVPEAVIRERRRGRARPRRPEDEQELRQHARDLRRREGAPEEGHVDRHGQPDAGRAEARRRPQHLHPAPQARRAPDVAADFEARLRAGGLGYGDLKKALFEHYWSFFARRARPPGRAPRGSRLCRPGAQDGAERARSVASVVIRRARRAAGPRLALDQT